MAQLPARHQAPHLLTGRLHTISTAAEAHSLTSQEAARAYPVHLRGIITCLDPTIAPGLITGFIHDPTGSIYVSFPEHFTGPVPAGTIIDVIGRTDPGTAAPIIVATEIRVIGHASLPPNPPREDLFHLENGAADAEWVEVDGTIHSVLEHDRYVTLQLAMMGGSVVVVTQKEAGVDYPGMIDAKVRIRGNAAPMFNHTDQIIGARIMVPNSTAVTVLEPAPKSPFEQPAIAIDNLLRWNQLTTARHRVHLRGQVTLNWTGSLLCLQDATRSICAQTVQDTPLAIGDIADVVGFAEAQNGTPILMDSVFRKAGIGPPLAIKSVTSDQALLAKDDSGLVSIEGRLIGSDLASSGNTLLLNSGTSIFSAILPKSLAGSEALKWEIGSTLRITGICTVQMDTQSIAVGKGIAVAESFRVLMRSPQDVTVLKRPSWWTASHTIIALGALVLVVLAAIGWITRLRRRVRMQTAALRKAQEEAAAIDELATAMKEVTAQRKLSARVSPTGSEQIAQLGVGFNKMLSELEEGALATKAAEAKLQHQALTDELTGLPNRRALSERLNYSLNLAQRESRIVALLFIDLDGFKALNDNLGHAAGDLLLIEVSRRFSARIRKTDSLARLGGDEFTVLLTSLKAPQEAELVARTLLEALAEKLVIEGSEVTIGASIGISLFPQDAADAETLLQQADSAMYVAKNNGKNQVHCFTAELGYSVRERLSIESQLRGALNRGEIHLDYQPEFDITTSRLIRFEALARWTHPVLGTVSPTAFIPVAEENGQIIAIGTFVLRQACIEAVKWQSIALTSVQVAVNVSSLQFVQPTFVDEVAQILEETRLDPSLLQIELTESVMLLGQERAAATMWRLRALGVSLAIDGFGTGYSCLSYLPSLPFDVLKIDRSFVRDVASSSEAKAIVSFLITLAYSLKMQVVVEGVETIEQLEIVRGMHGREIQGFLLGPPMADPQSILLVKADQANIDLNWAKQVA